MDRGVGGIVVFRSEINAEAVSKRYGIARREKAVKISVALVA